MDCERPRSGSHSRVSCTTASPRSSTAVWRRISCSTASRTCLKELMFFSSALVPSFSAPCNRSDTLASQRSEPSSMLPSLIPKVRTRVRRARMYSAASSAERMSGSLTISTRGTPARLKSTKLTPELSWIFLPASSSRWMRVSRTLRASPAKRNSTAPPSHRGSSYCEI